MNDGHKKNNPDDLLLKEAIANRAILEKQIAYLKQEIAAEEEAIHTLRMKFFDALDVLSSHSALEEEKEKARLAIEEGKAILERAEKSVDKNKARLRRLQELS